MRICLLSREYPPDTGWGGVGTYTYHIAHGLAGRGHDVNVVCLAAKGQPDSTVTTEAGIKVHRVHWDSLLDELNLFLVTAPTLHFVTKTGLALWKCFLQLHAEKQFDVVEAPEHLAAALFNGTTAVAPLVIKLHTPHSKFLTDNLHLVEPTFDHQMVCMFENVAMTSAQVLCSPSEDMSRFVASIIGISEEAIFTSRNPTDIQRFSPEGERFAQYDRPTVLLVGRLEERKGVSLLIETVPHVVKQVPDAHFVVIGADTDTAPGGGSMLAYLQRRLADSGCTASVTFLPHVPIERMPDVYRSADVCVIPSLYDNAPYSCIEALACGRPVVASDAGGTKEYISEAEWGFVVPSGSIEALSKALTCLLQSQELRSKFGVAARKFVVNQLSREVIAEQMEVLYQTAIERWAERKPVYAKSAELALPDAVGLACAFDAAIFEAMSKQSLDFSLRHQLRFAAKRPKLFAMSIVLAALRAFNSACPTTQGRNFLQRIELSVAAKQPARYSQAAQLANLQARSPIESTIV